MRLVLACLWSVLSLCSTAVAQSLPGGYVSVTLDVLPDAAVRMTELRARLFAEQTLRPSDVITVRVAGYVEGLLADRDGSVADAIVRPQEAYVELSGERADLRLGYSRIVWGRLDEVQPSDVINPLDLARFFFEGRAEGRLPVPLVRGRLFFGDRANVDAVLVPVFVRGRFDQLDEPSSPFNLENGEPPTTLRNLQGGGRLSLTAGRVDVSAAVYRGIRSFPESALVPPDPAAPTSSPAARRTFPKYTMAAADFETVTGEWAWRGEAAVFFEDAFEAATGGGSRSFDGGVGFDRRAGTYHLSGSVLIRSDVVPAFDAVADPGPPAARRRTTTSLVASADRAFARERYRMRAFAVYNLDDRAAFLRNITTMELRENVSLEGSVGWFLGEGDDAIARFSDRDFLYACLRVHF